MRRSYGRAYGRAYGGVPIVVGRILLALIFILGGLGKIFNWNAELGALASQGMPAPEFFLGVALVIELIGGLMLFFGILPRLAAAVLFLYLIPVSVVMHPFWTITNPAMHATMEEMFVQFFKNISIMGGLLAVVGYESLALRVRVPSNEGEDDKERRSDQAA